MRKRIIALIWLATLFISALFTLNAQAATPLDPSQKASLSLHYQKEGVVFPDLKICIYRVAEAFPDGTFELIAPFSSYPVKIHGITMQEQWKNTALTLCSYIIADQVAPDRQTTTNEAGSAIFDDLATGLYLVREVIAENENGTYIFNQFMVYLPTPQPDGSFNYNVEANPKCTSFTSKTEYSVSKLWQDGDDHSERPSEITVEIYKDGVLAETQILNAENNWSYTWHVSGEDKSIWTVTEKSVPENYIVTIQQNGGSFSVINTHRSYTDIPDGPQTGDTSAPLPRIMAICFSGIVLLIMSAYGRRRA